ncbi:MAG: ABC transporter permease [Phycisphaeraceae bacterium]
MSQITTGQPEQPDQPSPQPSATGVRRGMLRRVLGELVLHWSARIGMVWVGLLALAAVFAPLLASSHPIVMRTAGTNGEGLSVLTRYEPGSLSSPLLRHLTEPDVLLPLVLLGLLVVVLWRGVSGGRRFVALLAFTGLVVVLGLWEGHLKGFIVDGHGAWLREFNDWRQGTERVAGVPPRAPVGLFVWWVLLWLGLGVMLLTTVAAAAGTVLFVTSKKQRTTRFWPILLGVVAVVGAWVALIDGLGDAHALWALGIGGGIGVAIVVLAFARRGGVDGRVLGTVMLLGGMLVGGWLVHAPVSPPRLTVPEQYREAERAGEIAWVIRTPIPYSPEDTLADSVVNMRFERPGMHPMAETVATRILRLAERATELPSEQVVGADALARLAAAEGEAKVAQAVSIAEAIFDRYTEEADGGPVVALTRPREQIEAMAGAELAQHRHVLGTTARGADLASNMIHGTRIALSVGFISTGIALVIGVIIGGLMGYFSGAVDLIGMRFVEMFSAIPTLFLLLAFVAAFEANLYIIMIIIGLTSWVGYAVYIRAEFLKLRQQEFIQAAQALGLPLSAVIFRHLLPNGIAPVLVAASFGVAAAIGYEATLSFLGIGLSMEASWGLLLEQSLRGGAFMWWIALTPGLAIFLTVFAYILIGEALRDAIDPRTQMHQH